MKSVNIDAIIKSWHTYNVNGTHEEALRSIYKIADKNDGKVDLFLLDHQNQKRIFTIDVKRIDNTDIWNYAIHHLNAYADCMLKQVEEQM